MPEPYPWSGTPDTRPGRRSGARVLVADTRPRALSCCEVRCVPPRAPAWDDHWGLVQPRPEAGSNGPGEWRVTVPGEQFILDRHNVP